MRSGTFFVLPRPSGNTPVSPCSSTSTGWLRKFFGAMAAAISLRFFRSRAYCVASTIAASSARNVFGALEANSRLAANAQQGCPGCAFAAKREFASRSEEHTSELQSRLHLVCRLLLEKKKTRENKTAD